MFYDAIKNDHGFQYDPFKAIVAPRPIGWISSQAADGTVNLAPYSFFNAFAQAPHYVAFGSGVSVADGMKDSLSNIEATGEFVLNLASFNLREEMNASSRNAPPDVNEFDEAGLQKEASVLVKPPRVAGVAAAMECRHFQTIPLPGDDGSVDDHMVIGRVVGIYINDDFINDGRVDTAGMQPISRLGYSEYAVVTEAFRMRRPD
ncbi:MAG: flavin reductase family protein [Rhizobiales bacterium]|nr:flavin reductase family protein [Hyphomicrobiales bacterium]